MSHNHYAASGVRLVASSLGRLTRSTIVDLPMIPEVALVRLDYGITQTQSSNPSTTSQINTIPLCVNNRGMKRLSNRDIVRLRRGYNIIIVVPPANPAEPATARNNRTLVPSLFSNIMLVGRKLNKVKKKVFRKDRLKEIRFRGRESNTTSFM